ncbi:hypothetical protein, partial [Aminobacterium sp. UBA4908]
LNSLSFSSPLSIVLRALFCFSLTRIVLHKKNRYKYFLQEDLVAFLHKTGKDSHVSSLFRSFEKEEDPSHTPFYTLPNKETVLFLSAEGGASISTVGELKLMVTSQTGDLPEWWSVPIPLLAIQKKKVILNEKACSHLKGYTFSYDEVESALQSEEPMLAIDNAEGRMVICPIEIAPHVFMLDDVTCDLDTAENMIWWAAVGQAWAQKKRRAGYRILRVDEEIKEPSPLDLLGADEYMTCIWDGKVVGHLCLRKEKESSE